MNEPVAVIVVTSDFHGHLHARPSDRLRERLSWAPVAYVIDSDSGETLVVGTDRMGYTFSIYAEYVVAVRPWTVPG